MALMAGIAITMILSAVAVQTWSDVLRRDNEAEMMFRAQDIARGLKRFQTAKSRLPLELKELMEPNELGPAFLRKLWKDPLVKDGKWQLLYLNPAGGLYDPTVQVDPQAGDGSQPGLSHSLLNPPNPTGLPGTRIGGSNPGDPTGLPIAGVKTRCTDRPFRTYKDKTEYSEWVFSIFDLDPRGAAPNQPNPQDPTRAPASGEVSFPPTK